MKKESNKPGIIRRTFSAVWGGISWLRRAVLNVIFIAIVVIILIALREKEVPTIPDQAVLVISPVGVLVERRSYSGTLLSLFNDDEKNSEVALPDIIEAISRAADDSKVKMIVMQLDELRGLGMSHALEISQALNDFEHTGKKVLLRSNNLSQSTYLLASFADELYLHPMGSVELNGLAVYRSYFKTLLDKLNIDFHVFRVGTYKSALEPMMRDNMSDADKASNSAWLGTLWQQYTQAVEENRGLEAGALNRYINSIDEVMEHFSGDGAAAALENNLIDGIKTRPQYRQYLSTLVDGELDDHLVGFRDYLSMTAPASFEEDMHDNKVAVITAEGNIVDGNEPYGAIGGDSLAELITRARDDEGVKALVLRINSGGGSAFASEVIREELLLFKESGKKLVVSMGPVAASGGYWIASPADEIWALPTTLTGSIGIFAALPNLERSLKHIGISNDGVGTTDIAGGYRVDRQINSKTQQVIQRQIENGYHRFLMIVAEGRDMSLEQVEKVAEGRVWSGKDALERGLVDQLGSKQDAIAAAANLAGLEDYSVVDIEPELSAQQQFMLELSGASALIAPVSWQSQLSQVMAQLGLPEAGQEAAIWFSARDPRGFYAQCANCVAP
ncbi:protease-4 [Sinobacterium caligoides]|uniref:Protease-4 n=1 Tax=Sinobacterium caligoides TaxID=933926 RepID=A0A3N2DMX6_9GAMM|nr:signal peptide peptidase SppA [Sinobacterium caligoides]ROS01166.1 protease-4 [Sinobacterium caligoides]